jgi:hypothetical protein
MIRIENYFGDYYDWDLQVEYTECRYKNGKEIYEGNIVKDYGTNPPTTIKYYEVGFKRGMFGLNSDPDLWWEDVEVVGNIYENPELLTTE